MTVPNVVKLSQAISTSAGAILVQPSSQQSKYEIFGIASVLSADTPHIGSRRPFLPPLYFKRRPSSLVVTSTSPGALLIARGDRVIGRYIDGTFSDSLVENAEMIEVPLLPHSDRSPSP